ncbi:MAG TPA: UDP-N-acetylglucosamine--N-acetylmuramyl-(pentapeptide) pyrophosphoryl-undecaprenol N-acetylglucosamine transferase [Candidatus Saccharimonadales bacterium]|nr:UDP-N-acetylglucosamine--N-acetylmuramyl-(pentapeptide) pyrophosphoryl-undecaprenol N-acetylglucosamine transferase [Candidatus Saccharimonadales bacterium]
MSLAHELKALEPDCQIVYIGHKGDRFDSLKESSKDFDFVSFIDGGKFRRYHGESLASHVLDIKTILLNIRDFFKVLGSVWSAFKILRRVRPQVVFSKGGFVVVPVGIAAHLLRIPIVTHDSDAVPGLANRIVGRWAVANATGMPAHFYRYPQERVHYVGVPVAGLAPIARSKLPEFKKSLGLSSASQVLLVSGGGNGSKRLNDLMISAAPSLLADNLALNIVHVCGQMHEEAVKQLYKAVLPEEILSRVKVMGFTDKFHEYAASADLILARAGATSLAEFAILGKACVVMPSPFLAGGHQLKNAEELKARDAAVVVDEDMTSDEFIGVANELLNNPARRQELGSHLSELAMPDAAHNLAKLILASAKEVKA